MYFIIALKGQKFIKFTSGKYGYRLLAKGYDISWKTVESMVRKYKKTGTTITKQK